jgi:hypothetical protein
VIDIFLPNMFFSARHTAGKTDELLDTPRLVKRKNFKKAEIVFWILLTAGVTATSLLIGLTLGGQGTVFMLSQGFIHLLNIAMGLQIAVLTGILSLVFLAFALIARSKAKINVHIRRIIQNKAEDLSVKRIETPDILNITGEDPISLLGTPAAPTTTTTNSPTALEAQPESKPTEVPIAEPELSTEPEAEPKPAKKPPIHSNGKLISGKHKENAGWYPPSNSDNSDNSSNGSYSYTEDDNDLKDETNETSVNNSENQLG